MLKLPAYQSLSREQDAINNLPLQGSYLVVGPPGTGKTILAIYRAGMFLKTGMRTQFLVHSKPLMQYLKQAIDEQDIAGSASTFHRWFWSWYRSNFHRNPPVKTRWVIDWEAVYGAISRRSANASFTRYDHIVVDEGQDFPRHFYIVLRLLTENITVFADENQRMTENHSTLEEIRTSLALQSNQMHRLTRNYRNTRPLAEFARSFYAGLSTGIPDLPKKAGPRPRLVVSADVNAQATLIARHARNHVDDDIGVLVGTSKDQARLFRLLAKDLAGTGIRVQMYISSNENHKTIDFASPGVKIINHASAKGLEFDSVFLPLLDSRLADPESDIEKMRFYVLSSRARRDLFLMTSEPSAPPLLRAVPDSLYTVQHVK